MKKTKLEKGITLIALIITIIALIILAIVVIGVTRNSGIINRSEETKFKSEVTQIQEQLELKKMEVGIENAGVNVSRYNITIDNLDISSGLKTKYGSKLTISKEGVLYYQEDNVTEKEIKWLEDLGIKPGGFIPNVRVFANNNVYTEYGNKRNFYKIYNDIKAKYPNAIIMSFPYEEYLYPKDLVYLAGELNSSIYETKKELESKYPNPENELITQEVKDIMRSKLNNITYNNYLENNDTVDDILVDIDEDLKSAVLGDDFSNYLVINGEENVLITQDNIIENYQLYDEIIIMYEEEAKEKFTYTEKLMEEELVKGSRFLL